MNFRTLVTLVVAFSCASASFVQAQKLNADYPEIRLADGRVLSEASVASFNKKTLTFCIGHSHGIEAAVPWGAMPTVWQAAFPLEGADVERGAAQIAAAKKSPRSNGHQEELQGSGTVARNSRSNGDSPSARRKEQDLETLNAAAEQEDRKSLAQHYKENRASGLTQEEAAARALVNTQDDRSKSGTGSSQPTYGPKPPDHYGPGP
jgi:hypothetical protein